MPNHAPGVVRDPTGKPYRLALLLFLAYAALVGQFQGIQNILIPMVVERLSPTTKVSTLAVLSTLSAIATVIALFLGGWISDRTRSRWGRRTPSLVVSALGTAVASLALGRSATISALVVAMPLLWFTANYYQTVVTAILPDRVAPAHQGFVSAALALGVPAGIFFGVNVAIWMPTPALGYLALNVPMLLATAILVLVEREPSSVGTRHEIVSEATALGWASAFRSRDFCLAFASRFMLFLAFFTVAGYLFYVMQDYVGRANLPGGNAAAAVGTVLSLSTLAWLLITPVTGLLADRIGHTAGVVGVTSVAIGLVFAVPALSHSWAAMLAYGVGVGLTFGIYFAIDLKLVSMVLPNAATAGRDIGLMGIAASGPTVLAPALAAAIIQHESFPALFATGAALAVVGGLFAFPIRMRNVRHRPGIPIPD